MFFIGLDIEVFFHNEKTKAAELVDKRLPLTKYDRRYVTFYSVANIAPYFDMQDDGREYSSIHSGVGEFITPHKQDFLRYEINRHINAGSVLYRKN